MMNGAPMPPAMPPAAPLMPMAEIPQRTHDVVVKRAKEYSQCKIEPVPPEEFGISRNARTIKDADYAFHKVISTESKLIAQGYDDKQVKGLQTYAGITNTEETSRDTVWEQQGGTDKVNTAIRSIEVTEHYVRMDYEGDGEACLYKVTTGGTQGDILLKDGKPDIEPIDEIPFAGMTPVPMTHRFYGRSIADLVMDIQRVKTALLRGMLDNVYLVNNPRVEVAESLAGPQTLDDLLVSRPGGIVRTKQPGAITWQQIPNISAATYPALEYMDQTREMRTGVTRQGQGVDAEALQNQSATAVSQTYSASQARIRLIARIFAETGIKDLFMLVHAMIRKHGQKAQTVRLRNQWTQVDPREWKKRNDLTINVGLGGGSKSEKVAHVMAIISLQKEALVAGKTNLVQDRHLYNSAKELTKLLEYKNTDAFFADPSAPDAQPAQGPPPDPKLIQIQLQAEIEKLQAQADIETQKVKTQADIMLAREKAALDAKLAEQAHEFKAREHQMNMAMMATKAASQPKQTVKDADGNESVVESDHGNALAPMMMALMDHLKAASAPKTIRKNPDGSFTSMPHTGA
jgi:hypothetical protein